MPKLVVLTEGLAGRSLELSATKTSVGRVDDNQFCIPEASVSSHHCEVWQKGDDVLVKDLHSTNGTYINEVQIQPEKESILKPGQVLRLGQVELRYETGKKQTETPRATVKLGEGATIVISKEAGFQKKSNKLNKIFLTIGIVLALVIIGSLIVAFSGLSGGTGGN